jgi:hypothetical protein
MKRLVALLLMVSLPVGALSAELPPVVPDTAVPLLSPAAQPNAPLSAKVLVAAAEQKNDGVSQAPVQIERQRKHSWDNFWEVHFGGYRWLWWAGAAAVLVGIHVAAGD